MKCENCGFEQEEGKFCGQCGSQIAATNEQMEEIVDATKGNQPEGKGKQVRGNSETMEKVKDTTKMYSTYFMKHLKRPSLIFSSREESFKYGLTNIVITTVLIALIFYMLINNFVQSTFGYYDGMGIGDALTNSYAVGPSFLSVFSYTIIFALISIAIVVFILFLINHLFGTAYSIKEIVSIYGAHLTSVIVLGLVAFLLVILKSNIVGGYIWLLVISLVLSIIPVYLISSLLTRRSKSIDPVYGYLLYLISVGIAFIIIFSIIIDSRLGDFIDEMPIF